MSSPHIGVTSFNSTYSGIESYIVKILLSAGITASISTAESGFGECS